VTRETRRAIARFTAGQPAEAPLVRAAAKTGIALARRTMGLVHLVDELAAVRVDDTLRFAAQWVCGNGSVDAIVVEDADAFGGLCDRCLARATDLEIGLTVVYRVFDAAANLLYVGSTTSGGHARISAHRHAGAAWIPLMDPTRTTFERFDHELAARAAESRAIREEHPRFNKAGRRAS
jgi:hypothetical protein